MKQDAALRLTIEGNTCSIGTAVTVTHTSGSDSVGALIPTLGMKKIGYMAVNTDWGRGAVVAFGEAFKKNGAECRRFIDQIIGRRVDQGGQHLAHDRRVVDHEHFLLDQGFIALVQAFEHALLRRRQIGTDDPDRQRDDRRPGHAAGAAGRCGAGPEEPL